MAAPESRQAGWMRRPERSNMLMLRVMTWISLRLGRPAGRTVLHLIAAYFVLFAPASRAASRDYLARVLGRPARLAEVYRHVFTFAATIHDRIYLLNQRFDLFDIEVVNADLLHAAMADGKGVFLLGAHMGSFEAMRALGRRHAGTRIAMAMYEENARKINQTLAAINPEAQQDVIALGRIDSMLKVREELERGALVGMLADRSLGADDSLPVTLLGAPARLPQGPFRMAALLGRPVFFMAGLYRGGNRYEVRFEPLADFTGLARGQRQAAVAAAIARYAQLLENHCRRTPYNWFNFFHFWNKAQP